MQLNICHLYPKHLSLYGDRGNVISLKYRAEQRNIYVNVQCCNPGDEINENTNILVIGGGQDADQRKIIQDLLRKKEQIKNLVENGCFLLAICGGYQLLGQYYETISERIEGLNLLDLYTVRATEGEKRIIGNVKVYSEIFGDLWGFENHGGRTFLGVELTPLAQVKQGGGNNNQDKTEGVFIKYKNGYILGTYCHCFLPRNPQVVDFMISHVLQKSPLQSLDDNIENLNKQHGLLLNY